MCFPCNLNIHEQQDYWESAKHYDRLLEVILLDSIIVSLSSAWNMTFAWGFCEMECVHIPIFPHIKEQNILPHFHLFYIPSMHRDPTNLKK